MVSITDTNKYRTSPTSSAPTPTQARAFTVATLCLNPSSSRLSTTQTRRVSPLLPAVASAVSGAAALRRAHPPQSSSAPLCSRMSLSRPSPMFATPLPPPLLSWLTTRATVPDKKQSSPFLLPSTHSFPLIHGVSCCPMSERDKALGA
jgi:hypothetical protein